MKKLIDKATGSWDECGLCFDINTSSILTFLIKEAAKCDGYSSDLFIDWSILMKNLENENYKGKILFLGFRENGVDHSAFISYNLTQNRKGYYRDIYRLEVKVNFPDITMELYHTYHRPEPFKIPRQRLEEIATKFKDAYLDQCTDETSYFYGFCDIQEELNLSSEELKWLGIKIPEEFEWLEDIR